MASAARCAAIGHKASLAASQKMKRVSDLDRNRQLATIRCVSECEARGQVPDFVPKVFEEFEKLFRESPQVNLWTLHSYLTSAGGFTRGDFMKDVAGVSINYELNHGDSAMRIRGLNDAYRSYEVTYHEGWPEPKIIAVRVLWTEVVGLREENEKLRAELEERNTRRRPLPRGRGE